MLYKREADILVNIATTATRTSIYIYLRGAVCFKTDKSVRVRAPPSNKDRLFVWSADGENTKKHPRGGTKPLPLAWDQNKLFSNEEINKLGNYTLSLKRFRAF